MRQKLETQEEEKKRAEKKNRANLIRKPPLDFETHSGLNKHTPRIGTRGAGGRKKRRKTRKLSRKSLS